ncbi:F-box domain-containing protein [Phlyctema vagabunda]|uniref:F-box domain-containing protein n=1 Tax=Phlyctema vagabunda TaxID=108571 RepID=A0ABR4PCT2_9HELO
MSSSFSSEVTEDGRVVMENDGKYIHGRIDPGIDESISLVDDIPVHEVTQKDAETLQSLEQPSLETETQDIQETKPIDKGKGKEPTPEEISEALAEPDTSTTEKTQRYPLTSLPSELINHVLLFLSAMDLVKVSSTCRLLSTLARSDLIWQHHVQENVPGVKIKSTYPCATYRELYQSHDPHWFLTKHKIWFSDLFLTGKLILVRYDPRRGCIEGYRLVAERSPPTFTPWEHDDEVIIHSFDPHVRLHLDQPVIQLDALSLESLMSSSLNARPEHRFSAEIPMRIKSPNTRSIFSNFLLTHPVDVRPNMQLWPPPNIPASQRVRNASQESFVGLGHKPSKRSEVSDKAFRVRQWMEMSVGQAPGLHRGEEVFTYGTLDAKLYTPTKEKPYRGIWMGDYSGHGVEFLLMNQPDDAEPFDESSIVQRPDETEEEWRVRKVEERSHRGRIEAIKLTGDPNVPRGEYTFIADDIGEAGYIRTIEESTFKGARVVKSRGHIAARMFKDDKYIESQLILISPNRMAQYWVGFGHISFFDRVDIDSFLSPYDDNVRRSICPPRRI